MTQGTIRTIFMVFCVWLLGSRVYFSMFWICVRYQCYGKRVNRFSWNFQDMSYTTQEKKSTRLLHAWIDWFTVPKLGGAAWLIIDNIIEKLTNGFSWKFQYSSATTQGTFCNILGLEQEGGSLIAPMALAHPLHPIYSSSRNRRRNLWVGLCVSSWWPLFPPRSSVLIYIHIFICSSIWVLFLWFTNCVLLSDDNSLIPGCLWLLAFVLSNTLILGICCSTIPHLLRCFCRWTFFENIGFNMVPSDPFMSHLATQLGYSAEEFQDLQLIVLATFGVVD